MIHIKNKTIVFLGICCFFSGIISFELYEEKSKAHEQVLEYQVIDYATDFQGNIDEFSDKNGSLFLRGWAVLKGTSESYPFRVILLNKNTRQTFIISNVIQKRSDVTQYFRDGNNYDNSGFIVKINMSNLPSGEYGVFVEMAHNENLNTMYPIGVNFHK